MSDPTFKPLSEFKARSVDWLWEPLIPFGMLTIMEGDPGEGKSFLAMHLAALVSTGRELPNGQELTDTDVLYISAEDDASYTIRPRIEAMGGDIDRIWVQSSDLTFDSGGFEQLLAHLDDHEPSLVIVDPFVAYVPSDKDVSRSGSIRPMLGRLKEIAEEYCCAILLVRHLTKMKHDKAIYQGGGSVDLIGAARSAFLIGRHPENEDQRVLAHVKHNVGPRSESWVYELTKPTQESLPVVRWIGRTHLNAQDISGGPSETTRKPRDEAVEFLRETLRNGPLRATAVKAKASEQGIMGRTLDRAKAKLGVITKQSNKKWIWSLPTND